jgi:hypothetical protein
VNLLSSSFASGIGCLVRMLERTLFAFVVVVSTGGGSLFVLNVLPIVFTNNTAHIKIIFHCTLSHIPATGSSPSITRRRHFITMFFRTTTAHNTHRVTHQIQMLTCDSMPSYAKVQLRYYSNKMENEIAVCHCSAIL